MTDDGWSGESHVNNGGKSSDFAPGSNAYNGARDAERRIAEAEAARSRQFVESLFPKRGQIVDDVRPVSGGGSGGGVFGFLALVAVFLVGLWLFDPGHHHTARPAAASGDRAASLVLSPPAAAPGDSVGGDTPAPAADAPIAAASGAGADSATTTQASPGAEGADPVTADPAPAAGVVAAEPASADAVQPGPSFDCARAENDVQRLVCSTPTLAASDRRLAAAYHQAMSRTDDRLALQREEQAWIARRDATPANAFVLSALYSQRINDLLSVLAH